MKDVREATFVRSDPGLLAELQRISVATVCGSLLQLGFRNGYMPGIKPMIPGLKLIGPAVTLRYLPSREDLRVTPEERPNLADFQALEHIGPGDVLVCDVAGDCGGSTLGDVMVTRMKVRGGAGLVADGAIRDLPYLKDMGVPVFAKGIHAAPGPRAIWPADWNVAIRCGGVLVLPGDIIVADDDGVAAVPHDLLGKVVELGMEEEEMEAFLKQKLVEEDVPIGRYYPPNAETKEAARQTHKR